MTRLLLLGCLLAGCEADPSEVASGQEDRHFSYVHEFRFSAFEGVREVRDEEHGVTCWIAQNTHGSGISCLRDASDGGSK